MAFRFGCRFDFLTTALLGQGVLETVTGGSLSGISSSKFFIQNNSGQGSGYAQKTFDNQDTWIVNTQITINGGPIFNDQWITIQDAGTVQCSVNFVKSSGLILLYAARGGMSGTVLQTATLNMVADGVTTYDIEAKFVIHNTTGSIEVRVNGAPVINVTGANTRSTSNNYANIIGFGGNTNFAASQSYRHTHVFIMDGTGSDHNTFVGPLVSQTCYPTANGNYSQFTPSTGTNYQNVDDVTSNGDTDYNYSFTLNNIDTFTMDDAPANVTGIIGVSSWTNARRDAGSIAGIAPLFRISGTDYVGTNQYLNSTYFFYAEHFGHSPATSSDWSVSEFNNMESGYKKSG